MRLKLGIFASSGVISSPFFQGIVNWLIGADGGKLFASQSGTSFKQIDQTAFGTSDINNLFYGPDLSQVSGSAFLAATNDGKLRHSTDGFIWTTRNIGASGILDHIYLDNTSTTITTWTTIIPNIGVGETGAFGFARYYNNVWVGGGFNLYNSTNGVSWTSIINFGVTVNDVNYGNGLWVGASQTHIRTSTNAISWTTILNAYGQSVAYGNGQWVVSGGNNIVFYSTNGSSWTTAVSTFGNTIWVVAYGNGLWVGGGISTRIRTSTNGLTWTTLTTGPLINVTNIAYANGIWLTNSHRSTNGTNWTTNNANFGMTTPIAYGNGIWMAVPPISGSVTPAVSTDGLSWVSTSSRPQQTSFSIRYGGIAFGNGRWVVVGEGPSSSYADSIITTPSYIIGVN